MNAKQIEVLASALVKVVTGVSAVVAAVIAIKEGHIIDIESVKVDRL